MDSSAPDIPEGPLTADEFLAWRESCGFEGRFELVDGYIATMQAERNEHNGAKSEVYFQVRPQLPSGSPCRAYTDGMAVRLPDGHLFEPDAMIRCGDPLGPDATHVTDPIVVVEVTSPSNSTVEMSYKRSEYLKIPSVEHVVIIALKQRVVFHDTRAPAPDHILTRVYRAGKLHLDPPDVTLDLDAIFHAAETV